MGHFLYHTTDLFFCKGISPAVKRGNKKQMPPAKATRQKAPVEDNEQSQIAQTVQSGAVESNTPFWLLILRSC